MSDKKENNLQNDKKYLFEMQKFINLTENIEDEKLRKRIVEQMLVCQQYLLDRFE